MISEVKLSMCLLVAVCVVALVRQGDGKPMPRNLQDVVNNSMCPIFVDIDEDPERIPRRIKLLRCDPNPHRWCAKHRLNHAECCAHRRQVPNVHEVMECVEIRDRVLVKYPKTNHTKSYEVAVGCTCMLNKLNDALTVPPPT